MRARAIAAIKINPKYVNEKDSLHQYYDGELAMVVNLHTPQVVHG